MSQAVATRGSLAAIKRMLVLGATITITRHDLYEEKSDLASRIAYAGIKLPKKIVTVQGNAVAALGDGEPQEKRRWLYFKNASMYRVTGPNSFDVCLHGDGRFESVVSFEVTQAEAAKPPRDPDGLMEVI